MQRKNDALHSQIEEATKSNDNLLKELEGREEELQRLNVQLRSYSSQVEELNTLKDQHSSLVKEYEALKESEKSARLTIAQNMKKFEAEKLALESELKKLRTQSLSSMSEENKTQALKAQFEKTLRELEESKKQNSELLQSKHSMEEAVTSLVKQTQELRVENEEQLAFLQQARDTIQALKRERDEQATDEHVAGGGSSLLDELEANMSNKIKSQSSRPAKPVMQNTVDGKKFGFFLFFPFDIPFFSVQGAPENCEEYFLIAQTAVKIGLAIKFPHKSDEVFRVRGIDLYYKCLNSHVPFHQWHLWISRTLHSMLKGDVKPAAIMENSRKAREKDSEDNDNNDNDDTLKTKAKGWLNTLFN